jgi:16S rRNA (adenine1518-N6/adenine1519-N6)-dimethyltransferase
VTPDATGRFNLDSARALMVRYGLSPRKALGQNFLVDPRAQARIVEAARLAPDDEVIEIGPGLGAITAHLVTRAKRVWALERDGDLATVLETEMASAPGLRVVRGDALDFDFAAARREADGPFVLVGNLPYVITSPLLFQAMQAADGGRVIKRAVFMVQKEFAQRMVAPPGNKVFGRLSVMIQQAAAVEILFHVGAGAFLPPPAVTSTVVSVVPRATPLADPGDPARFERLVREAFSGRRKMLRRSLEPAFGGERVAAALASAGIPGTKRAEELAVAEFAALSRALGTDDA